MSLTESKAGGQSIFFIPIKKGAPFCWSSFYEKNLFEFYSFSNMGWVKLGKEEYLHKNLNYHEIVQITEKEAFIEIL